MASKRKQEEPALVEDNVTPGAKKSRPVISSAGKRGRKASVSSPGVPVFVVEAEDEGRTAKMPAATNAAAQHDPARSPKPPSAEEFKAILREGLANVAKKEQVDVMLTRIRENSDAIRSLESKVDNNNKATEDRIRRIEERFDNPRIGERFLDGSRQAAFEKSRKSLRAWPIRGEDTSELEEQFRVFAIEALQIPEPIVRDSKLASVIRVRTSPQNSAYLEALVTFNDSFERDFFFSKAKNLSVYRNESGAPTAGVRMDVPPYLLPTFRLLNDHGFEIRRVNGPETKRYIKFDEENLSLLLEVRLPGRTKWVKIRPDQARSYGEEKDRAEYSSIRHSLMNYSPSDQHGENPNTIPLGSRAPNNPPGTSTSSDDPRTPAPKWIPPPRKTPPRGPITSGYSLRNQQAR